MWLWVSIVIQVAVLAVMYYYIFLFFRGTRGAQVLVGLALLLMILLGLTQFLHLDVLEYILSYFSAFFFIGLLIIFQPEIRRALAELGRQPVFYASADQRGVVDNIVQAVETLAEQRVGALICVEREIGTRAIQETGVRLDSKVSPELLASIFFPHTPLHDGGVIIRDNRMLAAKCVFPLSTNMDLHKTLGTRHRAAVGISEETDAIAVVVSEETGTISVAYRGRLARGLDIERLKRFLTALIIRGKRPESAWKRAREQLDLTPEGIAKSEDRVEREKESAE